MNRLRGSFKRLFGAEPGGISPGGAALFAAALAAYAVVVAAPPALDLKYSLYLDTANFYWMRALWDRGLFGADPLSAVYYSNMFRVCPESFWVWPTAVMLKLAGYTAGLKLLALLACAGAVLLVRRVALASPARPAAGQAAVLFAVLFLSMDSFFGVPRVYGALVVLFYAWAAEERRLRLLPLLTALCFAVYPVVAAGLAVSSLLVPLFFREEFPSGRGLTRYLGALAAGAVLILLLLGSSRVVARASSDAGTLGAFESAKFHQMSPTAVDPRDPVDALAHFVFNFNEHGGLYVILMALLAGIYFLGLLVSPRRPAMLPRSVPLLLAGGAAAFALLYPLHPVTASRQLVFSVPLALVFLAAEGLLTAFGGKLKTFGTALLFGGLFLCLHPFFGKTHSLRHYAGAYEFLSAQPRGSTAAGYPESGLVLTAPVFAAQPALVSAGTADQEILFLLSREAYAAKRLAVLKALYCSEAGAAEGLAGKFGVKWLLFEKKYYSAEFAARASVSPRPYDREISALLAAGADPAACYAAYSGRAAFSWKNSGSEGFIVPLASAAKEGK